MTAKTKTKAQSLSPAAASRLALADAQALVIAREVAVQEAQVRVDVIERAWESGDDTITAAELTEAQSEAVRAEKLLSASKAAAKTAERNLVNDDADLADAVADALGGSLHGIPLNATPIKPEIPANLPAAFVVQTKVPKVDHVEGSLSGEVKVILYGPVWVARPDVTAISRTLEAKGIRLAQEPFLTSTTGEAYAHVVTLNISSAWAAVPLLAGKPLDWRVRQVGTFLAASVRERMQLATAPSLGVHVGGSHSQRQASTVTVSAGEARTVSSTLGKDGIRRTIVRASATVYPGNDKRVTPEAIVIALRSEVTETAGRCVGGVGRVESGRVVTIEPAGPYMRGRHVEADLTFVSREK